MVAIQRAVLRRDPADPDEGPLWAEESVTVEQMVESFTVNGAYAMGLEDEIGSIEVGKVADMAVLSRDILTIPAEEITTAAVELTVFGGRPVHAAGPFAGMAGD